MVLTAMHDRLAMDPVPLDRPGDVPALTAQLEGLISAEGTDPHRVMSMWTDVLAPHVMSSDASNFLAFIPAAPTKAALLFDMLVSGASIQGISALEASGAIAAENQVLRLLADLAGLPASAGGVFVSGGSAGNLSALTVARDVGRRRRGLGRGDLARIAVSDQAPLLDHERTVDPGHGGAGRPHRGPHPDRGGARGRTRRRPRRRQRGGSGGHLRHDQRRDRRSIWPRSAESPVRGTCGSTSTAPTAAAGCSRPLCARCTTGSSTRTPSSSIRTSGCSPPTTAQR